VTNYANGAASTVVTGSITGASQSIDGVADVSSYASVRIQISGTYSATLTPQTSTDGTNWSTVTLVQPTTTGGLQGSVTTTGVWAAPLTGRYFRLFSSAYTSGTAVVTILYSAAAYTLPILFTTINSGSNTYVGGGGLSSSTTLLAASTNATNAKSGAGYLHNLVTSNTSGSQVYVKLYDKATAPTVGTDTPVAIIPVAANTVDSRAFGVNGLRFASGIAWAVTGAQPVADTTAVSAGSIVTLNWGN
jgi:hypothetical protein